MAIHYFRTHQYVVELGIEAEIPQSADRAASSHQRTAELGKAGYSGHAAVAILAEQPSADSGVAAYVAEEGSFNGAFNE